LGDLVHTGTTAYTPFCTTTVGASTSNKTTGLNIPAVGTIGATTTSIRSTKSGNTQATLTSSTTSGLSLLGGVIQAKSLVASSTVSYDGKTWVQQGSSSLVGLTIAGRSIPVNPKPNQSLSLLGLGTVILNKQSHGAAAGVRTMNVAALELLVNPSNLLGLPSGKIIVGYARATLHTAAYRRAYGSAYATVVETTVNGVNKVSSGRTAAAYLPCGGTGGATVKNSMAGTNVPGVVQVGTMASTGTSVDSSAKTTATTMSDIANVSLLGGAITLSSVHTQAQATRVGSKLSLSSAGTTLGTLTVAGQKVSLPAMGKSLNLPGIGTLYIGRVIKWPSSIQVYGMQLVLSVARGGLSAGTVITVGAAYAGARSV
jgi:hypothetical protein